MKVINTILNYIDVAAPLLTLFFFIRPYNKMAKGLRYVFFFVLIQFACNLVASIMENVQEPNYPAYVVNSILSFAILFPLFFHMPSPALKKILPVFAVLFAAATIYSLVIGNGIHSYNSIASGMASFMITACCLVFFYWRLVHDTTTSGLTNSALFWIIIGLFTYYTGSFFIFISYNYLISKQSPSVGILWRFHNVLLTIFCIYTIYALTWKDYQKT